MKTSDGVLVAATRQAPTLSYNNQTHHLCSGYDDLPGNLCTRAAIGRFDLWTNCQRSALARDVVKVERELGMPIELLKRIAEQLEVEVD